MKTISGSIISSKSISLSKAASVMNSFLSAETGASTAVSSYLRRSSASFNELVQFHKELKAGRSDRKHKNKKSHLDNVNLWNSEENHEENKLDSLREEQSIRYSENSELGTIDEEGRKIEKKKKKKKKKRNESDQIDGEVEVERESGDHVEIEVEKTNEKKKRKKSEIEDEYFEDPEEGHRMKKKKRKHERET